ncbi:KAP family P-loop NTPase fold protein [Undibacterium sp. Ji50W]|uniref:KAP family P-loop NTPase fold protein n=1 Tax=Undibacterium sp. Ji50W TaxID=3413041 RepID=UPI003BF36AD8
MSVSNQNLTPNDIWTGDLLDRKAEGANLLYFLQQRYIKKAGEPGFVLALNGDWGSGKTFFIERVCRDATNFKHPTFVFDAWKNDFTKDPLLAFIAEFDSGLRDCYKEMPVTETVRQKIVETINDCWKPALTVIGGAILKHTAGMSLQKLKEISFDDEDEINSHVDDDEEASKGASDSGKTEFIEVKKKLNAILTQSLNAHRSMKASIVRFKKKLSLLVKRLYETDGVELPILVFIDELDRCRPDYAVELLEGIKHLFGVPGVYFIVSTNISQLAHSVKAIYGEGFDGKTYLKRFFDLQYSMSTPNTNKFCRALASNMMLPDIENIVYGLKNRVTLDATPVVSHDSISVMAYVLEIHVLTFRLTARDQVQVSTIVDAALLNLKNKQIHIFFLVFLAVIYHRDLGVYSKIVEYKKLDEVTGYPGLRRSIDNGQIKIRKNGQNSMANIDISIVAVEYFKAFRRARENWSNLIERTNVYDFPENLTLFNSAGQHLSYAEEPEFVIYPDIIRRAGGFSKIVAD